MTNKTLPAALAVVWYLAWQCTVYVWQHVGEYLNYVTMWATISPTFIKSLWITRFPNWTPISFFAASFCLFYLLFMGMNTISQLNADFFLCCLIWSILPSIYGDEQLTTVRSGNEARSVHQPASIQLPSTTHHFHVTIVHWWWTVYMYLPCIRGNHHKTQTLNIQTSCILIIVPHSVCTVSRLKSRKLYTSENNIHVNDVVNGLELCSCRISN